MFTSKITAVWLMVVVACISTQQISGLVASSAAAHNTIFLQPKGQSEILVEDFLYNKDDVSVMKNHKGHVDVHDFKTGLHIIRLAEKETCFVFPTSHAYEVGPAIKEAVQSGVQTFHNVDVGYFEAIGTALISDTDFLPKEAAQYCQAGYQWAKTTGYAYGHEGEEQGQKRVAQQGLAEAAKGCWICILFC